MSTEIENTVAITEAPAKVKKAAAPKAPKGFKADGLGVLRAIGKGDLDAPAKAAKAAKAKAEKPAKAAKAPKAAKPAKQPKVAKAPKAAKEPRQTKTASMIAMLSDPKGATVKEIAEAFGWLPHTTRAAISTLPKKQTLAGTLGNEVIEGRGRVYRITA